MIPSKLIFQNKMPVCNSDIVALSKKPPGTVTEKELIEVLKRYNVRDGLITLAKKSFQIFSNDSQGKIGSVAYQCPKTGVYVTQFALSYIANILLISGSNDHKSKYLNEKDNLEGLCNIYNSFIVQPETTEQFGEMDDDKFVSFWVRANSEQLEHQFAGANLIARTIIIYNDLVNRIPPKKFEGLPIIFEKETGLSLGDYLQLSMAIGFAFKQTGASSIEKIAKLKIEKIKTLINTEMISKFINILKADYQTFGKEDNVENKELDSTFTKTRFNPLLVYPIIETSSLTEPLVIPNIVMYIRKAFAGLFWWFHRFFEDKKLHNDFRTHFGDIFQEYVGIILKGIYGEENVRPEIKYGRDQRFIDWWIPVGEKCYLFETKAYQFRLHSKQTGSPEQISTEIMKIVEAVVQVYKRTREIETVKELEMFRKKKIIPVIIFMDIPLVSTDLYQDKVKKELTRIEHEEKLAGLKDFEVFLLNIDELEFFGPVSGVINLEEVFPRYRGNIQKSFLSILREVSNKPLRNELLDKVYCGFWDFKG